jgi:hypothetical protein
MAESNPSRIDADTGHELSDLSARGISLFGLGLALLVIVALLVCYGLLVLLRDSQARRAEPPSALSPSRERPVGPQLEVQPGQAMKEVRRQEEKHLKSYGWIDREKGVAHIPIERAMEILANKGLPARKQKPSGAAAKAESEASRIDREPRS